MCNRIMCRICRKITWTACEAVCEKHIESVMQGVPIGDRCICNKSKKIPVSNSLTECKDGVCRTRPFGGNTNGKK